MEFIIQNWMLILAIVFVVAMLVGEPLRRRMLGIETATVFDAVTLSNHEGALFVDVREKKETSDGIINGAVRAPLSNFAKHMSQLDKHRQKPVIVYCRSGSRSMSAAGKLRKAGFERVYNLTGGIVAWQKENLPLEK
jgi:rhodanese-related sulfurtransferase